MKIRSAPSRTPRGMQCVAHPRAQHTGYPSIPRNSRRCSPGTPYARRPPLRTSVALNEDTTICWRPPRPAAPVRLKLRLAACQALLLICLRVAPRRGKLHRIFSHLAVVAGAADESPRAALDPLNAALHDTRTHHDRTSYAQKNIRENDPNAFLFLLRIPNSDNASYCQSPLY